MRYSQVKLGKGIVPPCEVLVQLSPAEYRSGSVKRSNAESSNVPLGYGMVMLGNVL